MYQSFKMKKLLLIFAFTIIGSAFAQNNQFSEKTLQKFADTYKEVRNENMTLQLNMITEIEDAGLTSDKFTKIHMLLKDPEKAGEVSDAEKRKYNIAVDNIEKLNQSIQESIERIIAKNGLKVETYHSIAKASQNDTLLQRKIQEYMK